MAEDPIGLAYLSQVRSPLHRLSPLSKMVWVTCMVVVAMVSSEPLHLLVMAVLTVLVALGLTGASLRHFLKPTRLFLLFWGPFIILPPLAFVWQAGLMGLPPEDTRSFDFLGLTIPYSQEGVGYANVIVLRGYVVAMACLIMVWVTHPRDLVYALTNNLKVPYTIAWAMFLALIYTPVLVHEYEVISHAQAVRRLRPRPGPLGLVDGVRNTFFPLMVRGLRKGYVTSLAMESRAFGAYPSRVFRVDPPSSPADRLVLGGSVAGAVLYIGWYVLVYKGLVARVLSLL